MSHEVGTMNGHRMGVVCGVDAGRRAPIAWVRFAGRAGFVSPVGLTGAWVCFAGLGGRLGSFGDSGSITGLGSFRSPSGEGSWVRFARLPERFLGSFRRG